MRYRTPSSTHIQTISSICSRSLRFGFHATTSMWIWSFARNHMSTRTHVISVLAYTVTFPYVHLSDLHDSFHTILSTTSNLTIGAASTMLPSWLPRRPCHIDARHQLHVLHLHLNPLRVSVVLGASFRHSRTPAPLHLAARSRHLDFTRQPHATRASTHLGCQRSCSSPPPLS